MSNQDAAANFVGGWSPYRNLTADDKKVFDQALKGFVGVKYTPETVSTQLVSGTNYRFKCNASIPPSQIVWQAIVEVYKPLNGDAYITGIIRL